MNWNTPKDWELPCDVEGCGFVVHVFADANGFAPRAGEQAWERLQEHKAAVHNQETDEELVRMANGSKTEDDRYQRAENELTDFQRIIGGE